MFVRKILPVVMMNLLSFGMTASVFAAGGQNATDPQEDPSQASLKATISVLEEQLHQQQAQIDELTKALAHLRELPETRQPQSDAASDLASTSGTEPDESIDPQTGGPSDSSTEAALAQNTTKVEQLSKQVDTNTSALGGFKLSGDFRFRLDTQLRSGNEIAGTLQNVRSRYRLRLNADKELDPKFKFHMQLSTGPFNVGTTNDQDMAGTIAKAPFSIAEAYVDFHPTSQFSIPGGRMEEVFADNMRFLWDDDVRFNGFQQTASIPLRSNVFKTLEVRSGEYFL